MPELLKFTKFGKLKDSSETARKKACVKVLESMNGPHLILKLILRTTKKMNMGKSIESMKNLVGMKRERVISEKTVSTQASSPEIKKTERIKI